MKPVAVVDEAARLEPMAGPDATAPLEGVTRAGEPAAIADALAAGAIDAETAKAQLIDAVVAAQLPADAPPALFVALRDQVAAMLAQSPLLDDLLRRV